MAADLPRKLAGEALGTALLLAVVIGSGVMAERLAGGNGAIALLANTLATVGGLYILIEVFGPVSGAHFNPAVSAVMAWRGELAAAALLPYVTAQLLGAMLGAWLAHAMFDLPLLQWSAKARTGTGQWIAEAVATAGLLLVILRAPAGRAAAMVASYIGAAYWFTASTSFANPAAAFGRMFSDSFAGIAPGSVPGFVAAELAGAAIGLGLHRALEPRLPPKDQDAPPGSHRSTASTTHSGSSSGRSCPAHGCSTRGTCQARASAAEQDGATSRSPRDANSSVGTGSAAGAR
jgi:glycerol uptake facilitator-like aquaporin